MIWFAHGYSMRKEENEISCYHDSANSSIPMEKESLQKVKGHPMHHWTL